MTRIILEGNEMKELIVKPHGNGAHVTLPKGWAGRLVTVVLREE